ncbi:MAG: OmpA family protein [Cytophagales bacterium]|nr:OmpA family protein [Cytophagales bacterium]
MPKYLNIIYIFAIFFISFHNLIAQDVMWATKLLELTDRFQFENNSAELVLGPPTIYPAGGDIDESKHDPYSEGYIIHYVNTNKKNEIKVTFNKIANAKQVVIGGIFNPGVIYEIYVQLKDGKEKLVYKNSKAVSKTKFRSFATFIPYSTIYAVRVVLDHSAINEWNIIKGIGVLNADKLYDISPQFIADTSHKIHKEQVAGNINSKDCFEFSPKVAPDGKTLYFVKECEAQGDQDIWYSELDSAGKWSEAKNAGVPLNNKGHNFVASISPDGNTLVLGNKYNPDGTSAGDGVSVSHKTDDGKWSVPENIEIPDMVNINDHVNYYMNNDGNVMLIAMQDKKSVGGLDLYVSMYDKITRKWQAPVNLGNIVNSPFDEDYPFLANDGVSLYFSSKGHLGYGGHDVYVCKRLDDSWTKWSAPLNLGPFINSKVDDKGFVIDNRGDHAYFNTGTFEEDLHHMDIYKVGLPMTLWQNPRILINGTVFDDKTNEPMRATITVKDEQGQTVAFCASNPKTGAYALSVTYGKVYEIYCESIDYFKKVDKILLNDITMGIEMKKDFPLGKFLDSGAVYTMKNIQFEFAKATLMEESYHELEMVADMMKQQKRATYEIAGHTDNVGSQESNLKLSEDRANTVRNYLISHGVKAFRLTAKGYGELLPIGTNDTEEGMAINRRVEFRVLEIQKANKEAAKSERYKISKNTVAKKKK